jgi:hypothetical protein
MLCVMAEYYFEVEKEKRNGFNLTRVNAGV